MANASFFIQPTVIPATECIGNSLTTINNNFKSLYDDLQALQNVVAGLATVPVGTIAYYGLLRAPSGWVPCDGTTIGNGSLTKTFSNGQVITADFTALYRLMGTTLPDLRGMFIRGSGTNAIYKNAAGAFAAGGTPRATHATDSFASHTHYDTGHSHNTYSRSPQPATTGAKQPGPLYVGKPGGDLVDIQVGHAQIQATGSAETQPVNISLLACIKY